MGNVCSACFGKRAESIDPSEIEPILKAPNPPSAVSAADKAEDTSRAQTAPYQADAAPKTSAPVAIPVSIHVMVESKLSIHLCIAYFVTDSKMT
jgi:hypothetical protein